MIEDDKRLFVMAERNAGHGEFPWYSRGLRADPGDPVHLPLSRRARGLKYELLAQPRRRSNPLFQLNHWVEKMPRSPDTAAKVNDFEFLKRGARECERRRGLLPNIVAVDYYDQGDLQEVTRVLNGIPRDGEPQTTGRPTDEGPLMEALSTLTYEADGRIARITLNRPERGNGITLEMPRELAACVERANLDPEVHVIALAGNGTGFCGGYDLVARPRGRWRGSPTTRRRRARRSTRWSRPATTTPTAPGTRSPTSR